METILAILLYLHIIASPGTYNQSYINQVTAQNQAQITAVENDPAQMQIVNTTYLPQVSQIIIIDDTGQ